MLPSAILTIAPSSRPPLILAAARASRAGTPATAPPSASATCRNDGFIRATPTADRRADTSDAHQSVTETGPQTVPERDLAARATFAPHRCRRFHT
ncbi:hypothetical protein FDA94_20545 [Herbidospora galbida]|uniref:Uncharacterized protein n=1 Tax=Herbidospora galbida TaxID=2575442 RepID=A0A4U3MEB6_9ACTN|nr:hypothetical protein [Herbidospora galbida]TKK86849.1 hypothetical protein FDA94_20545 [Herbidospora galbida]